MQRDINQINEQYRSSKVDPWGAEWRGSMMVWHNFCINSVLESIRDRFSPNSEISILDIGCGSGVLSEKLYQSLTSEYRVSRYVGADVSAAAIEKADTIFPDSNIEYTTVTEDLLEVSQQKFDIILGFGFLPYLSSKERQNLFSVLRNNINDFGILAVSCNIRMKGEDHSYINDSQIRYDFGRIFMLQKIYFLYLAQFIEDFEGKFLRFAKFSFIRKFFSSLLPPKFTKWLFDTIATRFFPNRRLHLFILYPKITSNN